MHENHISPTDVIQCCLICKSMYCMPCLHEKGEHEEHLDYMCRSRTFEEYMIKPKVKNYESDDSDDGQDKQVLTKVINNAVIIT